MLASSIGLQSVATGRAGPPGPAVGIHVPDEPVEGADTKDRIPRAIRRTAEWPDVDRFARCP